MIHPAYSLSLQRGYRLADLPVVYPVARGTGPMLSTLGAFLTLGERPKGRLAGCGVPIAGVILLSGA